MPRPRLANLRYQYRNKNQADSLAIDILLAYALNKDRLFLYQTPDYTPAAAGINRFRNLVKKYRAGEPLAYLVGSQEFMSLPFLVNRHTLIPRPETELLVEEALNLIKNKTPGGLIKIIEIGAGCGNIAVSLAYWSRRKRLKIFASDISRAALRVARRNAVTHGVASKINFQQGNLFGAFQGINLRHKIDLIISNPPYVSRDEDSRLAKEVRDYEPPRALYAGNDGTELQQKIIDRSTAYLKPNGYLIMEMGIGQSKKVQGMLKTAGSFKDIRILPDYNKIPRLISAQYRGPAVI